MRKKCGSDLGKQVDARGKRGRNLETRVSNHVGGAFLILSYSQDPGGLQKISLMEEGYKAVMEKL